MTRLKATEVFTPGSFPHHTYVERSEKRYEDRLRDALGTPGQIGSLSGPSKSGKTVLVERVVGNENLIAITGAGIYEPEDIWARILDWMASPTEIQETRAGDIGVGLEVEARGEVGVPFIAKGHVGGTIDGHITQSTGSTRSFSRRGMGQVISEIANSDFVVLIDDFHYMPRNAQEEVAKQIKEAARQGVKIITASVPHRFYDVVRANPELRGRVMAVDLTYWENNNLKRIADIGFELLNVELNAATLDDLVSESAGSPQLMQAICLTACFEQDFREAVSIRSKHSPSKSERKTIFERTAANTNFRSLVDVLIVGQKQGVQNERFTCFLMGHGEMCTAAF